jgi:hypothetical protein
VGFPRRGPFDQTISGIVNQQMYYHREINQANLAILGKSLTGPFGSFRLRSGERVLGVVQKIKSSIPHRKEKDTREARKIIEASRAIDL